MHNNTIVIPTGYMGSGSSAITGIVSEIEGFCAPNASFEYIFMHCPDGLFDLEDKLLNNNSSLRSDEAIHRFDKMMKSLFDLKHFWPGSYNQLISKNFYNYVEDFTKEIMTVSFSDSYWYFQELPSNLKMRFLILFRLIIRKFYPTAFVSNVPLSYKNINISIPTQKEFEKASKFFLQRIFNDLGLEHNSIIMDQLLLPHNLIRLDNYFDQNVKVIVVDRDPRDVFILNKYFWKKSGDLVPYPFNVNSFINYYQRLRESEKISNDPRILRVHFEDLIYNYTNSIKRILEFLAAPPQKHTPKKFFIPEESLNNTQVFSINSSFLKETELIEKALGKYLYTFPYPISHHTLSSIF